MKAKYFIFHDLGNQGEHIFKAYDKRGELIEKQKYFFYSKREARKNFINLLNNLSK